jgi:hypothetical protein
MSLQESAMLEYRSSTRTKRTFKSYIDVLGMLFAWIVSTIPAKLKLDSTRTQMTPNQIFEEDMVYVQCKRDGSGELGLEPTIILGKSRIQIIKIASRM